MFPPDQADMSMSVVRPIMAGMPTTPSKPRSAVGFDSSCVFDRVIGTPSSPAKLN